MYNRSIVRCVTKPHLPLCLYRAANVYGMETSPGGWVTGYTRLQRIGCFSSRLRDRCGCHPQPCCLPRERRQHKNNVALIRRNRFAIFKGHSTMDKRTCTFPSNEWHQHISFRVKAKLNERFCHCNVIPRMIQHGQLEGMSPEWCINTFQVS